MEDNIKKPHQDRAAKRIRIFKNEESLKNILDNMKCTNIHIMRTLEGEEREQGIENLLEEIMTENFPNLVRQKDTQVQEAQRVPNKLDPRNPTPRHIIIKMTRLKDKDRTLKATREKQVITYKGAQISLAFDYSTETSQAKRTWYEIFK